MIELLLALLLTVAIPLIFWSVIDAETDDTQEMDRRPAERTARADASQTQDRQRDTPGRDDTRL